VAWTTPRSWSAGETVTSTILNTHVRDNLNAIVSPPYAYIRATTATSVGDSAYTYISFNTQVVDTDNLYTSASPTRLTIATAGLYMLTGGYSLALTAGTLATARFSVNRGLLPHSGTSVICGATGQNAGLSLTCFYQLSVGDYVELTAYSNRTAVNTFTSNGDIAFMQARWMGP
jgi:hypothetical protein